MNYEGVVKIWTGIKRDGGGITFYELYSKTLKELEENAVKGKVIFVNFSISLLCII